MGAPLGPERSGLRGDCGHRLIKWKKSRKLGTTVGYESLEKCVGRDPNRNLSPAYPLEQNV